MAGIRDDSLSLYTKDLYKAVYQNYKEKPTKHNQIFMVKNDVTGAGDKEVQLLGPGRLTRHTVEGQDIIFKSPVDGWPYYVKYWTLSDGISLTKEAVEDTVKLGNLIKQLAGMWGKQVRIAEEELGARVFNEGGNLAGDTYAFNGSHTGQTDPSGALMYDGFPLFNLTGRARSTKGGGTYFNSIAALTVTAANFQTLYDLHTATNNRDERDEICENPADTFLVESGADRWAAERIVDTSKGHPGGQLNDANVFYKIVDVIDWDYLSDGGFFIGKRQSPEFQFHKRQRPEIRFFRDENNRGYKVSIDIRQGVLLKDWRVWSRGGGTSA